MRKRNTTLPTTLDTSHLQLLAVPEVAKLLSIGRTTVYALINDGKLQAVKIGSSRRIPAISVHQYIERNMQAS